MRTYTVAVGGLKLGQLLIPFESVARFEERVGGGVFAVRKSAPAEDEDPPEMELAMKDSAEELMRQLRLHGQEPILTTAPSGRPVILLSGV